MSRSGFNLFETDITRRSGFNLFETDCITRRSDKNIVISRIIN